MRWTSTSNMLFSTLSGSTPWLIVRLPCGSMSKASTLWPDSLKATARLSAVVVLATPPFWLAKAITLARRSSFGARASRPWLALRGLRRVLLGLRPRRRSPLRGPTSCSGLIRPASTDSSALPFLRRAWKLHHLRAISQAEAVSFRPCKVSCVCLRALTESRSVPDLFDKRLVFVTGKGGVGKSTVSIALGLAAAAARQADDRLRGLLPGERLARLQEGRGRLQRGRGRREPVGDLDRPRREPARVPAAPAEGAGDARPAGRSQHLQLPRGGHPRAEGAGHDRQGLGARPDDRKVKKAARVRPGDRRRARDRTRRRLPADPPHLRRHRPSRADPLAGEGARRASSPTTRRPASRSSPCPRRCR